MLVEERPISSIRPYPGNPRLNDAAVDAVAASIREFGFRQPIVVDEQGVIIVGHTRYLAAIKLGLETVPVHVAVGLSPAQAKAYRIADNQTATLSQWDNDRLPIELAELQEMGFDMDLTGFSADELLRLLGSSSNDGLTDPDDIPEPPDEATTKPGDLWLLGNHKLLCGDSSNPDEVDRLLDGAPIHLVNTDPPYNVKVEPRSNNTIAAGNSSFAGPKHHQALDLARQQEKAKPTQKKLRAKDRPLANDFVTDEEIPTASCTRGSATWPACSNPDADSISGEAMPTSATIRRCSRPRGCTSRKPSSGSRSIPFSRGRISWDITNGVSTAGEKGAAHQFLGPKNATDVWSIKKVNPQSMIHLTEKPVELASRAMEYSSKAGENVLDLFGGMRQRTALPSLIHGGSFPAR